jgi:hypothetical protein
MIKKRRYLITALYVSIGCLFMALSMHSELLQFLGSTIICSYIFVLEPGQLTKKITFLPKWRTITFLNTAIGILSIALVLIVFNELPDHGRILTSKWYFVGVFWLICLAGLARRYAEEMSKARQIHEYDHTTDEFTS